MSPMHYAFLNGKGHWVECTMEWGHSSDNIFLVHKNLIVWKSINKLWSKACPKNILQIKPWSYALVVRNTMFGPLENSSQKLFQSKSQCEA
jgi:hypothetical protein